MHDNALAHLRRVRRTVRVLRDQKLRSFANVQFLRLAIVYTFISTYTKVYSFEVASIFSDKSLSIANS